MSQLVTKITKADLEELKRLCEASTQVVGWYAHPSAVRGPFGRWFTCSGGDNGMGDPVKYPVPVAQISDDCKFAAAAMNALQKIQELEASLGVEKMLEPTDKA